ncbi:hypothetical protein BDQ12DRAFT_253709 [Crucibulum laeve]|uniref:Uncharacterized protein n=1 Tax=Crucibulum laeve TaxID=68775 RepID=A0A5C3LVR7_9AGAR|nr:hypothetical protein BDQ12DRAFT_253709 [Crucibulum laeve]
MLYFVFLVSFAITSCLGQTFLRDLSWNFTLAAVNTTLPNTNDTGVPLVLGQNGATSGIIFHVTSTISSYPYNDYPALALVDGSLRAYGSYGDWITNATAVKSGGTMGWVTTTRYAQSASQDYSVITLATSSLPALAAHGLSDQWSLCPFSGFRGQTNVVFNVSANIPAPPYLGYDPASCYGVTINIIPVQ